MTGSQQPATAWPTAPTWPTPNALGLVKLPPAFAAAIVKAQAEVKEAAKSSGYVDRYGTWIPTSSTDDVVQACKPALKSAGLALVALGSDVERQGLTLAKSWLLVHGETGDGIQFTSRFDIGQEKDKPASLVFAGAATQAMGDVWRGVLGIKRGDETATVLPAGGNPSAPPPPPKAAPADRDTKPNVAIRPWKCRLTSRNGDREERTAPTPEAAAVLLCHGVKPSWGPRGGKRPERVEVETEEGVRVFSVVYDQRGEAWTIEADEGAPLPGSAIVEGSPVERVLGVETGALFGGDGSTDDPSPPGTSGGAASTPEGTSPGGAPTQTAATEESRPTSGLGPVAEDSGCKSRSGPPSAPHNASEGAEPIPPAVPSAALSLAPTPELCDSCGGPMARVRVGPLEAWQCLSSDCEDGAEPAPAATEPDAPDEVDPLTAAGRALDLLTAAGRALDAASTHGHGSPQHREAQAAATAIRWQLAAGPLYQWFPDVSTLAPDEDIDVPCVLCGDGFEPADRYRMDRSGVAFAHSGCVKDAEAGLDPRALREADARGEPVDLDGPPKVAADGGRCPDCLDEAVDAVDLRADQRPTEGEDTWGSGSDVARAREEELAPGARAEAPADAPGASAKTWRHRWRTNASNANGRLVGTFCTRTACGERKPAKGKGPACRGERPAAAPAGGGGC